MKKKIITLLLLITFSSGFSQNNVNTLRDTVKTLQSNNFQLRKDFNYYRTQSTNDIEQLQNILKNQNAKIDSLQQIISVNSENITKTANDLGIKIKETEINTNQQIQTVNKTISQNTLYWIIAILSVVLLLIVVFVLLRKQIFKQKTDLENNILNTQKNINEETLKLYNKLVFLIEAQLKVIAEFLKQTDKELNHSLALRVADEIIYMRQNMSRMDEKTKGLKQLAKSVERIRDEFAANGYEIAEMLGKPFVEGMNVTANPIPDDTLKPGEKIISRIIKPQVNFKGVMIQQAQIDVSQGD